MNKANDLIYSFSAKMMALPRDTNNKQMIYQEVDQAVYNLAQSYKKTGSVRIQDEIVMEMVAEINHALNTPKLHVNASNLIENLTKTVLKATVKTCLFEDMLNPIKNEIDSLSADVTRFRSTPPSK